MFPWDTHHQGRKASSDLVQLRNNVVKVDKFEGDSAHSLHGLATPVTIQRVQGAWAIQIKGIIVQLSQVTNTQGGGDSIPGTESNTHQ